MRLNHKYQAPIHDIINFSRNPVLMPRMPFGKHAGKLFSEVPKDYLEWLSGTELDEDMAFTVKYHLGTLNDEERSRLQ